MSQHLLASTRKGLFTLARDRQGWRIERHAFLGDNVTLAHVDARDGSWYAALNLGHFGAKLQRSDDAGKTWIEVGVPAYAPDDVIATADGKPPKPATLTQFWSFASGGANEPGRLWAGTIPGGLFRSDDRGEHWQLQRRTVGPPRAHAVVRRRLRRARHPLDLRRSARRTHLARRRFRAAASGKAATRARPGT